MKNQLSRAFIVGIFMAVAAVSAFAQAPSKVVVDIPFSFVVGDKTFPAGEYSIKSIQRSGGGALLIRSEDGGSASMFLANSVESGAAQKESKLLFKQYGNRYFLSQVWISGAAAGREVPMSRGEAEEIRARVSPSTVTLTGRRQ